MKTYNMTVAEVSATTGQSAKPTRHQIKILAPRINRIHRVPIDIGIEKHEQRQRNHDADQPDANGSADEPGKKYQCTTQF